MQKKLILLTRESKQSNQYYAYDYVANKIYQCSIANHIELSIIEYPVLIDAEISFNLSHPNDTNSNKAIIHQLAIKQQKFNLNKLLHKMHAIGYPSTIKNASELSDCVGTLKLIHFKSSQFKEYKRNDRARVQLNKGKLFINVEDYSMNFKSYIGMYFSGYAVYNSHR